jgi:hypothetical protein
VCSAIFLILAFVDVFLKRLNNKYKEFACLGAFIKADFSLWQVRLACLHTWEYLIQRLSHWLKSPSVFKLIAQPVYSLILGPNTSQNATGKNEERRPQALFNQVLQHFVRFLEAVPSGEKKTGSPVGKGSLERGLGRPADGSGAEEALEVLWDVKQVAALVEILGLVREQAFLDGSISALDVLRSAKGREGRLEVTGPPSPVSPLLPAAISGAAVDATGPKGLAGKRVGAPGPVKEQVEVSAGEALLAGWVALLKGVARAGRTQMRPSEEHVVSVHSLLTFVAETMTRANESVLATWQLVRVLVSELGAVFLASVSYSLPLPTALAGGASGEGQGKGLGVSTPRKGNAEATELFTPGAFLLAVWLSTVSPLFPPSSDTNPPRISQEVGEPGVKVTHERVKAGVNELVDLSCGRLDVLVGASRLVRVLEVLTGVTSSEPVTPSTPKGRQETTDALSGYFNISPGLLMYTWQEVMKQVTRLVIRSNDIPTKGAAGQAVCTVLLLPLKVLGGGGFSQGLEEGFEETLDATMREWALLWEAAYRVTQLKNVQVRIHTCP